MLITNKEIEALTHKKPTHIVLKLAVMNAVN